MICPAVKADEKLLADAEPGKWVCSDILAGDVQPDIAGQRLRQLGLCPGTTFELSTCGNPLAVSVCGSLVGISQSLASRIVVRPVEQQPVGNENRPQNSLASTAGERDSNTPAARPVLAPR